MKISIKAEEYYEKCVRKGYFSLTSLVHLLDEKAGYEIKLMGTNHDMNMGVLTFEVEPFLYE